MGLKFMSSVTRFFTRIVVAAAMIAGLAAATPMAHAQGAFAGLEGRWSGSGTITLSSGARESIRCRAIYAVSEAGRLLTLDLRCASDSYNFDLTGEFAADSNNAISGRWTENSRGIGGTVVGTARGDRMQVHVESSGFSADLTLVMHGRRQDVTIDSHGGGEVVRASISMSRR